MRERPLHKKPNTRVITEENRTTVRLHDTAIVWFDEDQIVLNSDDYKTVTTKRRMNQVAQRYCLNFAVYQQNFNWFIMIRGEDDPIPYYDGIHISRDRSKPHPLETKPESAEEAPAEAEYNGWVNRATWNVALWASNDYDLYQRLRSTYRAHGEYTPNSARSALSRYYGWGGMTPDRQPLAKVHWPSIADALNEMFKEN